ncbi:MAG: hypothetical protein ACK4TB_01305 [Gemmobacter sp.]
MRRPTLTAILLAALMALTAPAAEAACYADYKARRDQPYALAYGVIELPDSACNPRAAAAETARRIARDGWQLLGIVSIFGREGLDARRADAGAHFLRY